MDRRIGPVAAVLVAVLSACSNGAGSSGEAPSASRSSAIANPFTVTGRFDSSSFGVRRFLSLAIGPEGNLYLTGSNQTVTVMSPAGKVLDTWGTPGSGPGQFAFVAADPNDKVDIHARIAVGADGLVYVSDSGNHRIQVFTRTGEFVRQFGSATPGDQQLLIPFDVTADSEGNVYVADDEAQTVSKFSPSGQRLWVTGGPAPGDPDLVGHEHLAMVDPHGRLVMTNDDNGKVLYLNGDGRVVDVFDNGGCDVTVDAVGTTFVNTCDGTTRVFDRAHDLLGAWSEPPLAFAPRFGPNGEVFALTPNGSIVRLGISLPDE